MNKLSPTSTVSAPAGTVRARSRVAAVLLALAATLAIGMQFWAPLNAIAQPARSDSLSDRFASIQQVMGDAGDPRVLIVAHRGHHATSPENSIASIDDAVSIGAHIVELDVRRTADGRYILMHDSTIDRTTNGSGQVSKMSWSEMSGLLLMHGIRPTGERIPTLREALEACRGRVLVNIDLKSGDLTEVASIVSELGMADHTILKAWWDRMTDAEKDRMASLEEGVFMPIVSACDTAIEASETIGIRHVEFSSRSRSNPADEDCMATMRRHGLRVWLNSLKGGPAPGLGDYDVALGDPSVFMRLAEQGIGIIQTDLPEVAMEELRTEARTVD